MAARLNWAGVTVTGHGDTPMTNMVVVVRNNVATVSSLGHAGAIKNDVAGVRIHGDQRHADVEFVDGTVWTIERAAGRTGGCGCK